MTVSKITNWLAVKYEEDSLYAIGAAAFIRC